MEHDRTTRVVTPTGLGLLPRRGLITRRPGAAGPLPFLAGASIVVVALLFFLQSFAGDRLTLEFGPDELAQRWNDQVAGSGRPLLAIETPTPRPDESGDLVFGHAWTNDFSLRGRIDTQSNELVELSVLGDRAVTEGQLLIDAMDLLVRVTEPSLDAPARLAVLQELGVVGGDPTADLRAQRGDTDYVVAMSAGGTVGMSAAPHSSVGSGRS